MREIAGKFKSDIRFQLRAVEALQEAIESYLDEFFQDANLCAVHSKRIAIIPKIMQLDQRIRGDF